MPVQMTPPTIVINKGNQNLLQKDCFFSGLFVIALPIILPLILLSFPNLMPTKSNKTQIADKTISKSELNDNKMLTNQQNNTDI